MKSQKIAGVAAILIAAGLSISAAISTGSICGIVKDPSGAVVPNAVVKVIHGNRVDTISTNKTGQFEAAGLPSGQYAVRVEAKGFSPTLESNLMVSAGHKTEADASLLIQPLTEEITVLAGN